MKQTWIVSFGYRIFSETFRKCYPFKAIFSTIISLSPKKRDIYCWIVMSMHGWTFSVHSLLVLPLKWIIKCCMIRPGYIWKCRVQCSVTKNNCVYYVFYCHSLTWLWLWSSNASGTHQHKLLTANISAIFLPNELNIFGNSPTISRPQKKFKPVYPVFLVTAIS